MALPIIDPTNGVPVATNIATVISNIVVYATNYVTVTSNVVVVTTNNVSSNITGLDVVSSVNAYFSTEFDKLFRLVLCILGFVGVGLPILLPIYQKRLMRAELREELKPLLTETESMLNRQIAEKFSEEKKIIEKRICKTEGYAFHLQGKDNLDKKLFSSACSDLCFAADLYRQAEAGGVLTRVVRMLANKVLPELNCNNLEKDGLGNRLDKLAKDLGQLGTQGYLTDLLKDFENAILAAKNKK